MPVRHDRFVETNPDAILIEDARVVQKKSYTNSVGFGYVLNETEESAAKTLKEDRKSNDLLDEALSKAGTEVEKRHIDPSDKLASLSKECKQAIVAYTLESPNLYFHFNQSSRGVTNFFIWQGFQYKGLYDAPLNVYRGCKVQFSVNIGSSIIFQQFVSTTTDRKVAEDFASTGSGTLFIIRVSIALGIHKLSVYPEEEEYLLAPNHGYEVVNVNQNGNVREIYLETLDFSFSV
eukprot:gene7209-8017_t